MKKFIAILLAVVLVGCQCKQGSVTAKQQTSESIKAFFVNDGKEYVVGEKFSYVLTRGSSLKNISRFYDEGYAKGLKRELVKIVVTNADTGRARGEFSAFLNSAAGADVAKIKALADRLEIDEKKGEIEVVFNFDAQVVDIKNLNEIMKPSDRLKAPIKANLEILPGSRESDGPNPLGVIIALPVLIVGTVVFITVGGLIYATASTVEAIVN